MKYIILLLLILSIILSCSIANKDLIIKNSSIDDVVVNNADTVKTQSEFKKLRPCSYNNTERFIVSQNQKVGVIDNNNNIIIPIEYDAISNWVEYGPIAHYVIKNNKFGLLYYHNEVLVPAVYDSLYYYSHKIIKVKQNGKIGIIDAMNRTIIPIEYEALIVLYHKSIIFNADDTIPIDKFIVRKNEKWSSLNYENEIIREDISKEEIEETYLPSQLNNYDFEYIDKIIIRDDK